MVDVTLADLSVENWDTAEGFTFEPNGTLVVIEGNSSRFSPLSAYAPGVWLKAKVHNGN